MCIWSIGADSQNVKGANGSKTWKIQWPEFVKEMHKDNSVYIGKNSGAQSKK